MMSGCEFPDCKIKRALPDNLELTLIATIRHVNSYSNEFNKHP